MWMEMNCLAMLLKTLICKMDFYLNSQKSSITAAAYSNLVAYGHTNTHQNEYVI